MSLSGDQILAPSVNRFRVRAKPKPEANIVSGNSTDVSPSKSKTNKDGYKVNQFEKSI